MFIKKIYDALQRDENVILIGPRGCGKSTVIKGVVRDIFPKSVRYENMSILKILPNTREPAEHTVFIIDGMPPKELLPKISSLCTEIAGLQFIFLVSESKLPYDFITTRRIAVIMWPDSDCVA